MEGLRNEIERLKRAAAEGKPREKKRKEISEDSVERIEPPLSVKTDEKLIGEALETVENIKPVVDKSSVKSPPFEVPDSIEGFSCKQEAIPFDIDDALSPPNQIAIFLYRLLWNWSQENAQDKLYLDTVENLQPFFTLLLKDELNSSVVQSIHSIVRFLAIREYVQANDQYLRLSIGNAPWPIGVSMIGIHERSGGRKTRSNQVAHVLNDEQTRKWIQGIKRLMTVCQRIHPNKDRSKMIG